MIWGRSGSSHTRPDRRTPVTRRAGIPLAAEVLWGVTEISTDDRMRRERVLGDNGHGWGRTTVDGRGPCAQFRTVIVSGWAPVTKLCRISRGVQSVPRSPAFSMIFRTSRRTLLALIGVSFDVQKARPASVPAFSCSSGASAVRRRIAGGV